MFYPCPYPSGSPPLAREGLKRNPINLNPFGITPARAGRTTISPPSSILERDHPRSRGKDLTLENLIGVILGSPPLAREGQNVAIYTNWASRITPARAGRTHICVHKKRKYWDHPRSRGKDYDQSLLRQGPSGSPPLAREGLLQVLVCQGQLGITPARAGRTQLRLSPLGIPWDHPRSRGKDFCR